ncbi:unnamed protein product [Caretta caretta]
MQGSLSPSHSGCRCQCLRRRTLARSAQCPTRSLGQGPGSARSAAARPAREQVEWPREPQQVLVGGEQLS